MIQELSERKKCTKMNKTKGGKVLNLRQNIESASITINEIINLPKLLTFHPKGNKF